VGEVVTDGANHVISFTVTGGTFDATTAKFYRGRNA
jgi:hypothetical protein